MNVARARRGCAPRWMGCGLGLWLAAVGCGSGEAEPIAGPTTGDGSAATGDDDGGSGSGRADDAATGEATSGATMAATGDTTGPPSDGSSGPPGTGDDASVDGSSGDPPPIGLDDVGSLVVLGDSIGDGGGQGPFYYDLLRQDLAAHYGAIEYVNRADSGSETDALLGQVNGLPGSLPGPVAVVITSGGNDMKANILAVVAGADGPAKAEMQANIDAALDALLAPGRFGAGVEVHVFEGNIYDASDGVGDFGQNDCAFGGGFPTIPTDPFFEAWNGAIRDTVEAADQRAVDMHGYFYGHGYHASPSWYASDCTHPNTMGHDELRRLFYEEITGEPLP